VWVQSGTSGPKSGLKELQTQGGKFLSPKFSKSKEW